MWRISIARIHKEKIEKIYQIAAIFSSSIVCRPEVLKDAILKNSGFYILWFTQICTSCHGWDGTIDMKRIH
jgi:hypothetical protein